MPDWAPFLAVVGLLTVAILLLARRSQQVIHRQLEQSRADGERGQVTDGEKGQVTDGERGRPTGRARPGAAGADRPVAQDGARTHPANGPGSGTRAHGDPTGTTGTGRPAGAGPEPEHTGPEIPLTPGLLLANVAVTQALVCVVIVAAAWYFSIPAAAFGVAAGGLQAGLPGVVLGVVFGFALWVANELSASVADAVGATYDETVRELLAPASRQGWVALYLVVLPLIAVAEELLFRAALVGVPAAGYAVSPWLLVVVSSVAFALGHGAQGRVGILVTGVLGLALGAGYVLTGSLLVVVVAHYVVNALEFGVHEYLGMETLV